MTDDFDDLDFDEDEFLAAWDEVDREAGRLLADICRDVLQQEPPDPELERAAAELRAGSAAGRWPFDYFAPACGWDEGLPSSDRELWLAAVASTVSPPNDPGTDPEEQAAVMALQHADWVGIAAAAVRRGAGSRLDADAVLEEIDDIPDIEGESEDPEGDQQALDFALEVVAPLWQALGILDHDRRWTDLGRWGVPAALSVVWEASGQADDQLPEEEAATAVGLIVDGPLTPEELRRELAKRSIFADERTIELSLIRRPEVFQFDDGSLGHLPTLAEGLVLTHRVNAEELELGVLAEDVDLCLFGYVADEGTPLVGGGQIRARYAIGGEPVPMNAGAALVGPDGWLADLEPGDLVALTYSGGEVSFERLEEAGEAGAKELVELAAAMAQDAAAGIGGDGFPAANALEVVMTHRRDRPDVLASPLRPLSELFEEAGLEVFGGDVGVAGTAWYGEPEWLNDQDRATYRAWRAALRAHVRSGATPPPEELSRLLESLQGIVLDLAAIDAAADPRAAGLVDAMAAAATGAARAVPLYLLSRIAEANGDGVAWLAHLEAAVEADPSLREALGDLADLRSVAGDAREAKRLYDLAGVDRDSPDVAVLRRFLQVPDGEAGRNKPCPCGSGKKYKLCHGRTARHPLGARAEWLWGKVMTFLQRGANRDELLEWASARSGYPIEDRHTLTYAMGDSVTHEFALFDGELLSEFLETLGSLLPVDERELVAEWLESPRRLLEVLETVPMRGVTVRDLLTDETLEIRDRTMSTGVRPKDLIFGRPLPDGEGALRFRADPLSIPRMMRGPLLTLLRQDAPPEAVLELLSPSGRRPQLQTTEGQELVVCTARYDLSAIDETWAALAKELSPAGEDTLVAEGAGGVIQGRFSRSGSRISIETMALERLRALQALLLEHAPDARLVDESSRPIEDLLAELPPTEGAGGELELPADVIAQIVRENEERWLADTIPALGGVTPREAAVDPDLRPELEALLDDFEWTSREHPQAMTMDVQRLRRELGLSAE